MMVKIVCVLTNDIIKCIFKVVFVFMLNTFLTICPRVLVTSVFFPIVSGSTWMQHESHTVRWGAMGDVSPTSSMIVQSCLETEMEQTNSAKLS